MAVENSKQGFCDINQEKSYFGRHYHLNWLFKAMEEALQHMYMEYVAVKEAISIRRKENLELNLEIDRKKRLHKKLSHWNDIGSVVILVQTILLVFVLFFIEVKDSQSRLVMKKLQTLTESILILEGEKQNLLSILVEQGIRKQHKMDDCELQQNNLMTHTSLIVMTLFITILFTYTYARKSRDSQPPME